MTTSAFGIVEAAYLLALHQVISWLFNDLNNKLSTVEPRLSVLVGTSVNSPDNRESG